ncbi:MAG: zinc ribbon domain-containing protein [bacterium]
MARTCPQCGHTNIDEARFCEGCGGKMGEDTPSPAPAEPPAAGSNAPPIDPFATGAWTSAGPLMANAGADKPSPTPPPHPAPAPAPPPMAIPPPPPPALQAPPPPSMAPPPPPMAAPPSMAPPPPMAPPPSMAPPPGNYGAPPPPMASAPPSMAPPPGNYGAPPPPPQQAPPNYGAPPPVAGPPPNYGAPPSGPGAPPPNYGAPPPPQGGYNAPPPQGGGGYGGSSRGPQILNSPRCVRPNNDWVKEGFETLKADFGGWYMLFLPMIVVAIVVNIIAAVTGGLGGILALIMGPVQIATAAAMLRKLRGGGNTDFGGIIALSTKDYLVPGLIFGLIAMVASMCSFGIMGLVGVPLIGMAGYRLTENGGDYMGALKEAWGIYQTDMGSWCIFGLFCFGAILVGMIACGVGVIVAMPVVALACATAYRANYEA